MKYKMATVAILCLLLLETFLASDMDTITEPVLRGLRVLEKAAVRVTQSVIPGDILTKHKELSKFFLFTPENPVNGMSLVPQNPAGFMYFHPQRETKIIVHGFLDKAKIANWMHNMKDEFLLHDNYNVIIVDWSSGNFIPYSQAAANTERVGGEIAGLIRMLMDIYGADPRRFHLIGHSLGSHVSGYVGEHIKGIRRITGLDPATHLFTSSSPRSKLDRTDAEFVDVIHTDGGGIGMIEPIGHVDFYPNGGEVQPGCTASNSLRSLLEKGIVEGVRNIICSHMRAPLIFTDTINTRNCEMVGHLCSSKDAYNSGECDSCGEFGKKCAKLGFHVDTKRNYGNGTKFFLLTSPDVPYCGFEYKVMLNRLKDGDKTWRRVLPNVFRRNEWPSTDVLHINLYGNRGTKEFTIEGKENNKFQGNHIVFSPLDLGEIHGAIIRWSKKSLGRTKGVGNVLSTIAKEPSAPVIYKIGVKPLNPLYHRRNSPTVFQLCINPSVTAEHLVKGATFRNEYC